MKRRILSIIMTAALLLLLLAGCSRPAANTPAGNDTPNDEGTNGTATAPEYILRVGTTIQSSSPNGQLYYEFKEYVERESDGRVEVQVYHDSTMGNDAQLIEAMQLGTIEMAGVPSSALANFSADFMALDMPFLYSDIQTAYAALDGAFGDYFFEKLEDIGMHGIAWTENGFRNISANRPIHSIDDMRGLKIRVMEAPVYLETMKAFGANPTPMAFNELYTGLSQGTVDGQDNGIVLTYTAKLYEVQDYYTVINYVYAPAANIASKAWWDALPSDLQAIIEEGTKIVTDGIRQYNQSLESEYIAEMEAYGTEFIYLEDVERERFREACADVYEVMRGYVDNPEVIDLALEVDEKFGN